MGWHCQKATNESKNVYFSRLTTASNGSTNQSTSKKQMTELLLNIFDTRFPNSVIFWESLDNELKEVIREKIRETGNKHYVLVLSCPLKSF